MRIFGREPAVFFNLCAAVVIAVLLMFPLSEEAHGVINAAVLALAGFLAAAYVSVDAALPALTGLFKAGFAVFLVFGVDIPENTQVGILAVVAALGAFWLRTQVTARTAAASYQATR